MTPEAREVIARARRSFAFSIGLLVLGFIAIAVAIVYRSGRDEAPNEGAYTLGQIVAPAGARVISIAPGDGLIALSYELEGKILVRLIAGETGLVLRDIPVLED